MKIIAISTEDDTAERYQLAKSNGYITFIYEHADPLRKLASDKFMYVSSDEELAEKIMLVKSDFMVAEEVRRF